MGLPERIAQLPKTEQIGSRLRCILFTEGAPSKVAARFADLTISSPGAAPLAIVDPDRHRWAPAGLDRPQEAELGKTGGFVSDDQAAALRDWWIVHYGDPRLPSWDLVSQATIEGREGLILVEAKAHHRELDTAGKRPGAQNNHEKIGSAISEANDALNLLYPGWGLTRDSHYQLVNRFAWAWKLASMGVPVILVYLGFVKAEEMRALGSPISDTSAWKTLMSGYSKGIVPPSAWGQRLVAEGTPLRALVRASTWTIPPRDEGTRGAGRAPARR